MIAVLTTAIIYNDPYDCIERPFKLLCMASAVVPKIPVICMHSWLCQESNRQEPVQMAVYWTVRQPCSEVFCLFGLCLVP